MDSSPLNKFYHVAEQMRRVWRTSKIKLYALGTLSVAGAVFAVPFTTSSPSPASSGISTSPFTSKGALF